jgi:hypothetical protein
MSTTYYVKVLRLVPPATANRLGIPAEAPTFLSPGVVTPHRCWACWVTFTPLVYQTGQLTTAQHYHKNRGGIYFIVTDYSPLLFLYALTGRTGWLAHIEPVGKTWIQAASGQGHGRSEAVRITKIVARCRYNANYRRVYDCQHRGYALNTGILYQEPFWDCDSAMLLPVCGPDDMPVHQAPFSFRIQDGAVYFTQRHLP